MTSVKEVKKVYKMGSEEVCLEKFDKEKATASYCLEYAMEFDEEKGTCVGDLLESSRSIATRNPDGDDKDKPAKSDAEIKAEDTLYRNPNATDEEKKAACQTLGKKWKKRKKVCVDKKERGGLFGGDGPDIDFDDVKGFVGEAAENELVQGAAVGMLAGAGVGMARRNFMKINVTQ